MTAIEQLSDNVAGPVVSLAPIPLHPLVVLRIAEAGATFLVGDRAFGPDEASVASAVLGLDESFRLPTRWAMRESLRLAWDGDIAAFLKTVSHVPCDVWLKGLVQADTGLTRREIGRIRQAAHDIAGLPVRDFTRFSTSARSAPVVPEWTSVRSFILAVWGRTLAHR